MEREEFTEGIAMAHAAFNTLLRHIRRTAGRGVDSQLADGDLLARFLADRDEAAFAVLVRRHGSLVVAACRRLLSDPADVEDAFQATFLVLLKKAGTIRNQQSLASWLYRVASRAAAEVRASAESRRRHERRAAVPEAALPAVPDLSWRETCAQLYSELDRLPLPLRLPLILCYLDGKTRDETAQQLGWSLGVVRGRLDRGRGLLRQRLARRGVELSVGLVAVLTAEPSRAASPLLIRAAVQLAAGRAPSAAVATLAATVAAVTAGKAKTAVGVLLAVSLIASGAGFGLLSPAGPTPVDPPAAPVPQAPPALGPAKPTAEVTVQGRVLAPDGKPVAGAALYTLGVKAGTLSIEENLEPVARGTTDSDGRFRFDIPKDQLGTSPGGDPWPVMAAADGYGLGWTATTTTGEGLTIPLVKDHPITGRILDSEGRPVANAQVRVKALYTGKDDRLDPFLTGWKARWHDAWRHVEKRTVPPSQAVNLTPTDRDGRFRITGAGLDRLVILEVKAPALALATIYVVGRAGFDPKPYNQATDSLRPAEMRRPGDTPQLYGPTFDLVAAPGKTLTGMVRDAEGRPIGGARVMSITGWNTTVTATATADGRFTLAGLTKQPSYLLRVAPEKRSSLLARSVNVPDTEGLQPMTAEVMLTRGVIVTGRVIDKATGKGVLSSLRFAPLPENSSFGKPGYDSYKHDRLGTGTDKDGRFHLPIIPGAGVLIVQANSGESLDGQYLNPYMLATFDAEERKHVKVTEDGRNGYFTSADNSLESLGNEHAVKYLDLAENAGTVTLDLYLHRGKTAKLAIQGPDGQPLTGVVVSGVTAAWPITYLLKSAECPLYALNPDKPRTVAIFHPGRNLGAAVVVRGDETAPVVAKLQPTGTVSGRVLDPDRQPVAGAQVIISYPSYSGSELDRFLQQQRPPVRTDKDGRFKLEGVVPGMKFAVNNVRKGDTILIPKPRTALKEVGNGATLDLGDIHTEPLRR